MDYWLHSNLVGIIAIWIYCDLEILWFVNGYFVEKLWKNCGFLGAWLIFVMDWFLVLIFVGDMLVILEVIVSIEGWVCNVWSGW